MIHGDGQIPPSTARPQHGSCTCTSDAKLNPGLYAISPAKIDRQLRVLIYTENGFTNEARRIDVEGP